MWRQDAEGRQQGDVETEIGAIPSQAKEGLKLPELEEGKEAALLKDSEGASWFWTSEL